MSWGAIYNQSWWGRAIANDFGEVYSDEVNIKPLLKAIQDRSTYYENEAGTTSLLKQLEDCKLVETLGEELIVNGDFSNGSTGWNLGTGWSIQDGELICDGTQTGNSGTTILENIENLVTGEKYLVEFTISDYVSGFVNPHLRGNFSGNVSGNGLKSSTIIAGNSTSYLLNLFADSNFIGSIDNVSIKEIIQTA